MFIGRPRLHLLHSCSAVKMIAFSGILTALECTKFVLGWGSVPHPAEGAYLSRPSSWFKGALLLRGGKGEKGRIG